MEQVESGDIIELKVASGGASASANAQLLNPTQAIPSVGFYRMADWCKMSTLTGILSKILAGSSQ